jgi:formylglycine-generating enzyme required for sulfatase activity
MVDVGPFCIDSTEVTNAHYAAFLAQATAATIAAQPAQCAFNTTFVPNNAWPAALNKPTEPVAYVNWCDAYAYCAWAGKRMCGKVGGGSLTAGDFANTATSQWTYACTHAGDGQHAYPYGATYAPQACNGADRNADAGTLTPAGALATCVGGYPGIFDMSGNVGEFMDACSAATGAADTCHIGGGDANDALASVPCAHSIVVTRAFTSSKKGIRCCSL